MKPIACSEHDLRAAFQAHTNGASKFTRRMAIHIGHFAGVDPMAVVWRLEKMQMLKRGSWDWFKANGGITKAHIDEALLGLCKSSKSQSDTKQTDEPLKVTNEKA
jgi:hypothetical protein